MAAILSHRARRRKGGDAERELFRLLEDELGMEIRRNLEQPRDSGYDASALVGPYALEVKRQERLELRAWWEQAVEQANAANAYPALFYRQSRRPWRVLVRLSDLTGGEERDELEWTAEISLPAWCEVVREWLDG